MTSALANPTSDSVPDDSDGVSETTGVDDPRSGLRDERPPGISPLGVALGLGAVWGLLGYSVLWEGEPFVVDRRFVQSVIGTLILLPIRTVLWAIHQAERVAGRPFDFSANHWWIGVVAGAVGAAIVTGAWWAGRAVLRRLRAAGRAGFDTRR
jgi:hypothetical protein